MSNAERNLAAGRFAFALIRAGVVPPEKIADWREIGRTFIRRAVQGLVAAKRWN